MSLDTLIEDTTSAAGEEWRREALLAVERVALWYSTLTTDDIWRAGLREPTEKRAMGGVMRQAQRNGLITPTDRFVPTRFTAGHQGLRRVWRSRVSFDTTREGVA